MVKLSNIIPMISMDRLVLYVVLLEETDFYMCFVP